MPAGTTASRLVCSPSWTRRLLRFLINPARIATWGFSTLLALTPRRDRLDDVTVVANAAIVVHLDLGR